MHAQPRSNVTMLLLFLVIPLISACGASVDASKSYSRGVINRGDIVPANTIRVNEYLNYYEQRFPEPIDEPIGLDLRLGNPQLPSSGGEVWLQVGLQARGVSNQERTPLNLTLVLDTSGSMGSPDKMPYLKQSLRVFLQSLHPDDWVGIVTYSDQARVLRHAQPVGDGSWIAQTVDQLRPGGNTDLHDGLMAGFNEVDQNFDLRRNNRVILLTDGLANVGVTNPDQIAADAMTFSQRGIYLSTIGLGMDMNDPLLSKLARQGNGAYHFVDSASEMDKIFLQEAEGLVERVADDIRASIRPLQGVALVQVTGLEGSPPSQGAQVEMPAMGAGDSQVLMVRLKTPPSPVGIMPLAEIGVSYTDSFAQRTREIRQQVSAPVVTDGNYDPLTDIEVRRNATIVRSAEAMKTIDALFGQGRYAEAWELAHSMEQELRYVASRVGDSQMVQDADLFQRYQMTLAAALGYDPAQRQPETTSDFGQQPQRWGATPEPFEGELPTIEVR
jgi:Ca-activated chloride channel family protein